MSDYLGYSDDRLPPIPKPSLQQYDNYQIHDLYCRDIEYLPLPATATVPPPLLFKRWLAVERVSIHGAIECDFEAIANLYP